MAANTLFGVRMSSGGNRAFFSPLSPLAFRCCSSPVYDDCAVEHQHRRDQQEAGEVPAPEHGPGQAETENHAYRRKEHGGECERIGERVANRMSGQDTADGQVDPVDG